MARPRTFDEQATIERAMELFWTRGYNATSMSDLTEELGLHPGSLYRTFGDKHGLFLRALDCYRETQSARLAPMLLAGGPVLPRIRAVLIGFVELATGETPARGCLLPNTAAELLPGDPAVGTLVGEALTVVEDGFLQGLRAAERAGEIPSGLDLPAHAAMLTVFLQGLQIVVKVERDPMRLAAAVDAVLAPLQPRS
jgi:TetR/AcrR family transcriptional repressor of nem operon